MAIIYERPGMFDRIGQGVGGMFEGLRGWSQPRSNRLMLTGMGLLSGKSGPEGWEGAMKGLVAGSALDTENKRERALQEMMNDPNSTLGDLPAADRAFIVGNPDVAGGLMAARLKPADYGDKYQGYLLARQEGYDGTWMDYQKEFKGDGVNINMNQLPAEMGARIGLGDQFLDELNVSMAGGPSIRDRVKTAFGGDNAAVSRAQLAAGMGEPAAIWRRVESGKEALVRQLTGAGMAVPEAQQQAARYSISSLDSVDTMISKLDGLERDLSATREGALGARRGTLGEEEPAASGADNDPLGLR